MTASTSQAQETVSSEAELGFPTKGSLGRTPFSTLVREIAQRRTSGSLFLLSGQTKKVVFFEEGQPVFVRSNVLSECLGQILAHEGIITPEQCEQTLEAIRRTGKKQGELLVEMGILSEGNLRYGLEAQLRTKLFDIFSWGGGRYQFKPDPPSADFGVRLALSALGVIVGAIQEHYSDERARIALAPNGPKYAVCVSLSPEVWESLDLLSEELYFAQNLDGSRTIDEILTIPPEPPVPTPHALLYGMVQAGLVELRDTASAAVTPPTPPRLEPSGPPDDELIPTFEAQDVVTEYEDTPLPGALPQARGILGDHEADFPDVDDTGSHLPMGGGSHLEITSDLAHAEPESIEETFDDDVLNNDEPSVAVALGRQEHIDADVEVDLFDGEQLLGDDDSHAVSSGPTETSFVNFDVTQPADATQPADTTYRSPGESTLIGQATPQIPPAVPPPPAVETPSPSETLTAMPPTLASSEDTEIGSTTPQAHLSPSTESAPVQLNEGLEYNPSDVELNVDDDLLLSAEQVPTEDLLAPHELDAVELELELPVASSDEEHIEVLSADDDLVELEPDEELDPVTTDDDLVGLDELDAIDLPPVTDGTLPPSDGELIGAKEFSDAGAALTRGDYQIVISLLHSAYQHGFDVAELHAMLAYARFMADEHNPHTARVAFELLDYAEGMDPSLAITFAYRGAVHKALSEPDKAKAALHRAIELDPYCELAIELMDRL